MNRQAPGALNALMLVVIVSVGTDARRGDECWHDIAAYGDRHVGLMRMKNCKNDWRRS